MELTFCWRPLLGALSIIIILFEQLVTTTNLARQITLFKLACSFPFDLAASPQTPFNYFSLNLPLFVKACCPLLSERKMLPQNKTLALLAAKRISEVLRISEELRDRADLLRHKFNPYTE